MIDLQNIMDNIGLSENEKNLNTEQMTTVKLFFEYYKNSSINRCSVI